MISVCQVELLGQELADYVHPCDHQQLASLVPDTAPDTDLDLEVQYTQYNQYSYEAELNILISPFWKYCHSKMSFFESTVTQK